MKADITDGPAFLRPKKKNHTTFIISLVAVSAIFWTLVALFGKPIVIHIGKPQVAVVPKKGMTTTNDSIAAIPPVQNERQDAAAEMFWSNVKEKQRQGSAQKQTEFNDRNYVPAEAVNVVRFEQPTRINEEPAKKEVKVTVVKQEQSMKDRACWPYKEGSVERRNCRLRVGLNYRD